MSAVDVTNQGGTMSENLREQYARAIWDASRADEGTISATGANLIAGAVIGVRDEEFERLRRGAKTLGETIDKQCRMVLDATGRHDLIGEDGDGDWGAVWDHLSAMRPELDRLRAEVVNLTDAYENERRAHLSTTESAALSMRCGRSAEAECAVLRERLARVEALADSWACMGCRSEDGHDGGDVGCLSCASADVRAALASLPEPSESEPWMAFPGKRPVCRDCGADWSPVRRGECVACGSDSGPLHAADGGVGGQQAAGER